jgi:hypothetical protein
MFVELTQSRHPTPAQSIADHRSDQPLVDVDNVVAYLRHGHYLIDMMDSRKDVLDPTAPKIISGGSILTDGDWLWRGDYAYYVRRHNVLVPADLLTTIRDRDYIAPEVPEQVLIGLAPEAEYLAFGRVLPGRD